MPRTHHLALVRAASSPPPGPPVTIGKKHPKYGFYVRTIRHHTSVGGSNMLRAFYALLEFEKTSICWQDSPQRKFSDVIREEQFCSIARYRSFKRAVGLFRKAQLERLGLDAVCLIAKQPEKYHARLVRLALNYRSRFDTEPTYQYVSKRIHAMLPRPTVTKPTYAQLRNYCEKLQKTLRANDIRIPKMDT